MLSDKARTKEQPVNELEASKVECESATEEWETIFNSIADLVSIHDKDFRFIRLSKSVANVLKMKPEELIGKTCYEVFHGSRKPPTYCPYAKVMETKKQATEEFFEPHLGMHLQVSVSPILDKVGEVSGSVHVIRDITEHKRHKQAEEALRKSKELFEKTFTSQLDAIFVLDAGNPPVIRDCNPSALDMFGYTRQEVLGRTTVFLHVDEKALKKFQELLYPTIEKQGFFYLPEFAMKRKDATVFPTEHSVVPLKDQQGVRIGWVSVVRDITERKRTEEVLRKTEREKAAILNSMSEVVAYQDTDMRVLWANRVAGESVGLVPEQLTGRHCYEIWHQRSQPCVGCPVVRTRETGQPQEAEITTPDGRVWFVRGYPIQDANGNLIGIVEVALDITQRKLAEEALRESEVKLRLMFESVTDGITVTDLDGFITALNERALEMHGFRSKDEVLGKHAWEFIARRDHYKAAAHTRRTLEQGRPTVVEYTLLKADGSEFPGEISTSLLKDAQGNLVGFIGIIRDITERKLAEEALKDSEERYKSLVTNVKLGVFRSTPGRTGRFLEVNPAMEEITGYSREELLKINVSDLYAYPEEREAILEEVASARGKATKELRFRKKDGTEIVISDTKVAVRDDTGKILYFDGIIEDITERKLAEGREKELQQQLYLSSRLAAIGELAAGVAHEINNPLTGILGFSQRLLRKSAEETQVRDLEIICNEAQRAAKVVENLLTFARRQKPRKQYADINDILQKALELRAYQLKTSNIEVALDLAPSLPKTMVDFHQIQEVFLNIILNAEQAISETNRGGKLSIKTQPVRDYIKISFADDGPGIPAEHLDKLFNPFFTTRRERGGTGLGLSICHGMVAEHGGKIYAKSKPGKGATFFVELPVG